MTEATQRAGEVVQVHQASRGSEEGECLGAGKGGVGKVCTCG